MSSPRLPLIALTLTLLSPTIYASSLDNGVPVEVFDELGLKRVNELVKLSVPLAQAEGIHTTDQLALFDQYGGSVPVQWRVLTRWQGVPDDVSKPIRFALAQFLVDLEAGTTAEYLLRRVAVFDDQSAQPEEVVIVGVTQDVITIDTGPMRVELNTAGFGLMRRVLVDLDGNGELEPWKDEEIVSDKTALGSTLIDRFEQPYFGQIDPFPQIMVEEVGPLHVVVRVDARHAPALVPSIKRDFLTATTRLFFVAGSSAVRVEHSLKNTYLHDPMGNIGFARYFLHTQLSTSKPVSPTFGIDADSTQSIKVDLVPGEEAFLYQDSPVGTAEQEELGSACDGWCLHKYTGAGLRPELFPPVPPLATGERAAGWVNMSDGNKGILVALRFPWQNYPYALRGYAEGHVVIDLWPAEFSGLHWLDDAQRKTHEFTIAFHAEKGFDSALEATRYTEPLRPRVPVEYTRETLAWGDHGDLRESGLTFQEMAAAGQQALDNYHSSAQKSGGFGWSNYGEPAWAKSTHTTGSPRNRLTFFDRFMISGARSWFELNEIFALHSMDIRTYHIDGFKAAKHPQVSLLEGVPHFSGTDLLGRDKLDPMLDPHRAGIPSKGHGWNGYDAEHMVVDDLYEYYLLTGSFNALDAMQSIGQGILTLKFLAPEVKLPTTRMAGWVLRALIKLYQVSGDPQLLSLASDMVVSIEKFRGNGSSGMTGHVYHYLLRNEYNPTVHKMTQDYDMPWQIAVGIYGLALYGRETGDPLTDDIIADLSDYLLDYTIVDGVFVSALACDDHEDVAIKTGNTGINTWIASALGLSWRITGREYAREMAKNILLENDTDFVHAENFYHWYHTAVEVQGE